MTRQTDYTTRATLTAIAQQPAPSAVPFTLAGLAWQLDTLAATAVCDAGEKAMRHRHQAPGRLSRMTSAAGRKLSALWQALPGPWPVKALLVALAVAEPGPWGEMALAAYAGAVAARRARRVQS